jgi:hypothetical protein
MYFAGTTLTYKRGCCNGEDLCDEIEARHIACEIKSSTEIQITHPILSDGNGF